MTIWKPGMLAVCVDNMNANLSQRSLEPLVEGRIYRVLWAGNSHQGPAALQVQQSDIDAHGCWEDWRFRPLVHEDDDQALIARIKQCKPQSLPAAPLPAAPAVASLSFDSGEQIPTRNFYTAPDREERRQLLRGCEAVPPAGTSALRGSGFITGANGTEPGPLSHPDAVAFSPPVPGVSGASPVPSHCGTGPILTQPGRKALEDAIDRDGQFHSTLHSEGQ